MIGPVVITSESSIGAGTRRIEGLTGVGALTLSVEHRRILEDAAKALKVEPEGLIPALERLTERQRQQEKELTALRSKSLQGDAAELSASQSGGIVIARRDGLSPDQLRELAQAVRLHPGVNVVVLAGTPDGQKVTIAASSDGSANAGALVKEAAGAVGGGGGGSPELAVAGGRDVTKIDEALGIASVALGLELKQ
jgi:alanyl-tRNA synthetase